MKIKTKGVTVFSKKELKRIQDSHHALKLWLEGRQTSKLSPYVKKLLEKDLKEAWEVEEMLERKGDS